VTLGDDDPRFLYRFADAQIMGAVAREVVEFYAKDIGAHPVGTGPSGSSAGGGPRASSSNVHPATAATAIAARPATRRNCSASPPI
jgi:hypothetical protein